MRQILHIFAKDSRRFWPEIAVTLAILVAFVRVYPVQWLGMGADSFSIGFNYQNQLQILSSVLVVLVPVTWWLLIARVVHAESLVGDRQFWVTRPYEWKKLVGAKALFLLVYLYLPFYVAQSVLLAEAGFNPLKYVPGLLYSLYLVSGVLVVPLLAIASVTKNFARMVLTLLGSLIVLIAIAYLGAMADSKSASTPYSDWVSMPLILLVCAVAITVQYSVRKVWLARGLLVTVPIVVMLSALGLPDAVMMSAAYPRTNGGPSAVVEAPVQIAFDASQEWPKTWYANPKDKEVGAELPLTISGVAKGNAAIIDDVMVTLDGANGEHWSSSWHPVYNHQFLPGTWKSSVSLMMSRSAYEQFKSIPVTLRMTFAVTQVRAGQATEVVDAGHEFFVPDFGLCPPIATAWYSVSTFECRMALHPPALTYVSTERSVEKCDSLHPGAHKGVPSGGWVGSLHTDPADFGITSVWSTRVSLARDSGDNYVICPGTPIRFTRYELVRRVQEDLTVPNVRLPILKSSLDDILMLQLSR